MTTYCTGFVWFTGSHFTKERTIYTDGKKYFIRYYRKYIEVRNVHGAGKVTSGWQTVEAY